MNTETKARGKSRWLMPLALALPFLAAIIFALVRFAPQVMELINVAIKGAVVQ